MENQGSGILGYLKSYMTLGFWLVIAFVFVSLGKQWVVLTTADKQLTEYVDNLESQAALQQRAAKDVRTLVVLKAEELSIPAQDDRITVTGQGETLRTNIAYDAEIRIPVVDRVLYRMEFNHHFGLPARR
jgi:hypothetical protein